MKRAILFLAVLGAMMYGAYLSFSYDTRTVSSNSNDSVDQKVEVGSVVAGVLLPISDESSVERRKLLTMLKAKTSPERIIIIYSDGHEPIPTIYPNDWKIGAQKIANDKEATSSLEEAELAVASEIQLPKAEVILSEIAEAFPRAVYSMLRVPEQYSQSKTEDIAEFLSEGDPGAMVVSIADLDSDLPESLAKIKRRSLRQALSDQDADAIWRLGSKSSSPMLLSSEFSKNVKQKYFWIDDEVDVLLGYWSKDPVEIMEPSTSFVIAGDAMFDRNVWHNYKDKGLDKIFDQLPKDLFKIADISLLNLEGPISSKEIDDDYKSGSMVFNFPPVVPQVLKNLGIKAVSLANNHTSNAGSTGFANTQKVLEAEKISYFGRQTGFNSQEDVYRVEEQIPISFIGIDALAKYDEKALLSSVKKEKSAGRFVIIMPHWGEEYKTVHNASQKNLATKWIEAGAGLIVGSHPHVVQDFEVINGVPVVYSLGNFVFDQFFSEETQRGLIMAGTVTKDKITLSFLPTEEELVKPQLLKDSEKKTAISKIFKIDSAAGFTKISEDTIEISLK